MPTNNIQELEKVVNSELTSKILKSSICIILMSHTDSNIQFILLNSLKLN